MPRPSTARHEAEGAWLAFATLDMMLVLRHGAPLLASGGEEFEMEGLDEKPWSAYFANAESFRSGSVWMRD